MATVGNSSSHAPALAQVGVGLAMGGGTDVAPAAADSTLTRPDQQGIVMALGLAYQPMRPSR